MESVKKIVELMRGDIDGLMKEPIILNVPGFMKLAIEWIGDGPRDLPHVSVCHYFEQNGDLMKDPDLTFEIEPDGTWTPTTYQQDSIALYQEAIYQDGGKVMMRPKLIKELKSFARLWSRNLSDQGYIEAARNSKR